MFTLPKLSYDFDALEPNIDAKTMEIHYTKHHQGYTNKLNTTLEGEDDLLSMTVEEILLNLDKVPADKRNSVVNNGGGFANHKLFWSILTPGGSELNLDSKLGLQIKEDFGSLENCIKEVSDSALAQFGSGWGWLVLDEDGKLKAVSTSNQDSPYLYKLTPLLGLDVWEHAYYLNYQNRRPDYVSAFWKIVNWAEVEKRFTAVV